MAKIVEIAENHKIADKASFAELANDIESKDIDPIVVEEKIENFEDDNYLTNTPKIPMSVFDLLPPILKEGAEAFEDAREKDVFLTGALAILSGCMPNVSGIYAGRTVFPNLFCFIVAPAASGKGALQSSKELADVYHREVLKNSEKLKNEYDKKLIALKLAKHSDEKDKTSVVSIPDRPPFKVVFIPADTSNAKIIQHLQDNGGTGIICETEADTLGRTLKNDWGSYSDLLRKAFHHEKISVSRKTNNEFLEIDSPRLAVALSGTPNQVLNIISSAYDGLFSRFLFYVFKTNCNWLDPSPFGNQINLTEHFNKLALEVNDMVLFLNNSKTIILLKKEHWDKFNILFAKYLHQINTFVSEDAQSVVKRLGIILYRFCMIFSTIRKYKANELTYEIYCRDDDFDNALTLVEIYLQHSIAMFNNLPLQQDSSPFKSGLNKKQFFDSLPSQFTRKEAVVLGKKFKIMERTVSTLLKACIGKYLIQPKYGFYEKL